MGTLIQDLLSVAIIGGFILLIYSKFTGRTLSEAFDRLKDSLFGSGEDKEKKE